MTLPLISFLNAISFGMILFLLAMGLSITLGIMGVLNLTHGALFMVGSFVGLSVAGSGGNFWLAAIAGGAIAAVIGLVMERGFLHHLYRQLDDQVLLTLGLVYILENAALWIYGGGAQMLSPPELLDFAIPIGARAFPAYRLVLIGVGIIAFIFLWWLIEKTRVGAIVRAGMDDKEMAMGLGVNYPLTCSIIFTVGAFAGGFAGVLAAPVIGVIFNESIHILLYAMIVVVIGGPGSVLGTLIGALVIGLADTYGKVYLPNFAMFTMYILMIAMLLIKPNGILGRKQWED